MRRRRDFELAYAEGFRVGGRLLAAVVRVTGTGRARLGLAVGRHIGNAPERNRLKRRLRELFRQDGALRGIGVDVVVSGRNPAGTASFAELRDEYGRLSRRILGRVRG